MGPVKVGRLPSLRALTRHRARLAAGLGNRPAAFQPDPSPAMPPARQRLRPDLLGRRQTAIWDKGVRP